MGEKSSVDQLNSFLRGELSAVETYRMAIEKLDEGSPARFELESNLQSHEDRVARLREAITALGGTPATSSGPWGAFAKAVEGGARLFGDKAAIAALEEGEDHGLSDYRDEVDDEELDMETRTLIASQLLPEQQKTLDRLGLIKRQLA